MFIFILNEDRLHNFCVFFIFDTLFDCITIQVPKLFVSC